MLNDPELAEDTVQQMFVGIWEKRDSIEIQGAVKSYLMRSVHNTCLNHIKHEKVKQEHAEHEMHTTSESTFEASLEAEEFRQKVKVSVQKLPPQCKKIFLMSRLQGKKYQQIADELELSVKTVENQMGKALKMLRGSLKEEVQETLRVVKTIFWMTIGVQLASIVIR